MTLSKIEEFDNRIIFAKTLIKLAQENPKIVVVCNDSIGSSNLTEFRDLFPERLIDVGIAEQNMVGIAAGLANSGLIPFVCAASPFLTGRALEQIKADVVYSRANVKLCGMSPGVAYGELGPTHHSIEDIAWMRALDSLTIVLPADEMQTKEALIWAANTEGPVFMRIGRFKVPSVSQGMNPAFVPNKAMRIIDGTDISIIAAGTLVSRAIEAALQLKSEGISARVINLSTVVPLDRTEILAAAKETKGIITVEESVTRGGIGGAIAELVVQNNPVPMKLLGIDTFAPTGSASFLLEHFGLTAINIVNSARELLNNGE
ncbi:MAG: transketolase family protein [Candidatus Nanopelagicus sp.]|jgi:transketolase|nr:transketolase family protein [Candidatus Nanopelagicus sp.]